MKIELEPQDIQAIVEGVTDRLKFLLSQNSNNVKDDTILDVQGLCKYLNVTSKWIHERTHLKEIPYIKLSNKQLRFKKRYIDKWLDSLKTLAINDFKGKLRAIK